MTFLWFSIGFWGICEKALALLKQGLSGKVCELQGFWLRNIPVIPNGPNGFICGVGLLLDMFLRWKDIWKEMVDDVIFQS